MPICNKICTISRVIDFSLSKTTLLLFFNILEGKTYQFHRNDSYFFNIG